MNNNEIFIKLNKNYYYPNDIITGFIYLNIVEEINCSNIKLIIKGKEIIQTNDKAQNEIMNDYDNYSNINSYKSSSNSKNKENEIESNKKYEFNNIIEIFKSIHYISISKDNKIPYNKYIFPFVIKLPKNIPNSFLIYDSDMHIEVIYTIKAHLIDTKNVNNTIKEAIPILIRQKEEVFDYPLNYKTGFNVGSCCCEYGLSIMYINKNSPFFILGNERVSVKIKIDNKKCKLDGIPLKLTLYQKIRLFNSGNKRNKKKKKKFKEYSKCLGNFESKNSIEKNKILEENFSININIKDFNNNKYLNSSKSNKYFKDKSILNKLCVNFINEFVQVEYELYINTMFLGWSLEELGLIVQLLFYPPDYYDEETEMKIVNFNIKKDIVFGCSVLKINDAEDYTENEYNTIIKDFKAIFEDYVINNNKKIISNIIIGNSENENKIEFNSNVENKKINNSISDDSSSYKIKNSIINNIVDHNNNKFNSNINININEEDDNNEIDDSKRIFNKTKNFKFFMNDVISKINKNNSEMINYKSKINSNNNIIITNSKNENNNGNKIINNSDIIDNNKIFIEQSENNSLDTFNNNKIIINKNNNNNNNKIIMNNSESDNKTNSVNNSISNIKIVLKNKKRKNNKYKNFVNNTKNLYLYNNNNNEKVTIKRELNKFWLNDKFDILEDNNEEEEEDDDDEISNE